MKKMCFRKIAKIVFTASLFCAFSLFAGCEVLQGMLHDEMQAKLDEETGIALIDGGTWYFNGAASSNVAGSANTTLLISFSKKVAIEADEDGNSNLTGSMAITYNSISGEKSETYKISAGKIKYLSNSSADYEGEEFGSLSASGTEYRVDMTPVVRFLNGSKAIDNELSVELKLSGFVCDEGAQKGRAVGTLSKRFKVKPFFDEDTINTGVTFYTLESTKGKTFVIPTLAPVSLTNDYKLKITPSDKTINISNFEFDVSDEGFVLSYKLFDLQGKSFSATVEIDGFLPPLSGSSYNRTFDIVFTPRAPIVKTTKHTGDKAVHQLFTAADLSEYDAYTSVVINLIDADWGGKENNWWSLYASESEDDYMGGNDNGAIWSDGKAEFAIASKWFDKIRANGIFIKADAGCNYTFTVTYK